MYSVCKDVRHREETDGPPRCYIQCLFYNLVINHHSLFRSSSTIIRKCDDTLLNTDLIRHHTYTAIFVRHQRIKQILCDLQIFFYRQLRLFCKKNQIVHYSLIITISTLFNKN